MPHNISQTVTQTRVIVRIPSYSYKLYIRNSINLYECIASLGYDIGQLRISLGSRCNSTGKGKTLTHAWKTAVTFLKQEMTVTFLEQVSITCRSTWSYSNFNNTVVLLKFFTKGTMLWYDHPQTSSYCTPSLQQYSTSAMLWLPYVIQWLV